MSDRFPASIEIGGKLPASELEHLVEAANWAGGHLDYDDYNDLEPSNVLTFVRDGKPLELMSDQARYGAFEELEDYCRRVGLTYRRHSDAYAEYDAELVFWEPGMDGVTRLASDEAGQALISEADLHEFAGQGKTIAEVIAWLQAQKGPERLPALELIV